MNTHETVGLPKDRTLGECREELLVALEKEDASRINPADFRGVPGFSDAEIVADLEKVNKKKAEIVAQNTRLEKDEKQLHNDAQLVESLFFVSIRDAEFLSSGAHLVLPSYFDDYFRGVDAFVELAKNSQDPRHIGFSIDFTMSPDTLATKMRRTLDSLAKGFVPSVKYFDSPNLGKQKEVWMPRVIIGADYASVKRVADAYVETYTKKGSPKDVLKNDPVQFAILDEIRAQLQALSNISYEMFKNKRVGDVYARALEAFSASMAVRGLDEQMLRRGARGDSLHGRLVSLVGKFDRAPLK